MIGIISPLIAIEEFVEVSGGAAQSICFHPAGQGVNVARAVRELGEPCTIVGFVGGETGVVVSALLDSYGLAHQLVAMRAENAAVVKLTHEYAETAAYYLPDPIVSRHESDDLYSAASLAIMECSVVVFSSGLAEGMPDDFYPRLIHLAHGYGARTIVDVPPALLGSALAAHPTLVKPNLDQLRTWYPLDGQPPLTARLAVADDLRARGAGAVVLSAGETGALVVDANHAWQIRPPLVEPVVEAGAGDCMVGGLAVGLARGLPLPQAAALGAAAGCAKVMRHGLGSCKRSVVERLVPRVQATPIRDLAA
jgi:1-phosphofructokinase family hexose kinase